MSVANSILLRPRWYYDSLCLMENIEMRDESTADNGIVYEVSYLLLPSLAIGEVPAKVASLRDTITKAGGKVLSFEEPILIDLAYEMTKVVQTVRHKTSTGYFGWMKFEIDKEGIAVVKKALDADLDILRYLIIKTVRENTLLLGKMKIQKEERARKEEENEEVSDEVPQKESTPEEIDKSIDELVIV